MRRARGVTGERSLLGGDGGRGGGDGEDLDGAWAAARGEGRGEAERDVVRVERHPGGHRQPPPGSRELRGVCDWRSRLGCGCGGKERGAGGDLDLRFRWVFVLVQQGRATSAAADCWTACHWAQEVPYLCLFLPWIYPFAPLILPHLTLVAKLLFSSTSLCFPLSRSNEINKGTRL